MRVIVVTTIHPFIRGGAEYLTSSLCQALESAGVAVERFELPFLADYRTMLQQTLALRLLDLSGYGDRMIAIRTPSYVVQHHSKVIWFIHHHRPAFDLWGTEYQDVPSNEVGEGYRDAFRAADNTALRESVAVFSNSRRMAARLREYNGFNSEVLYPPLKKDHGLFAGSYGDYVLCPGRIVGHKRQHLCVEAIRHVRTPVRLLIAGPPDPPDYAEQLERRAAELGVGDRVSVIGRWLDETEKLQLFANALAVACVPWDEDSYGYVTLEAAHSRKAVITCEDSGGLLEFVQQDETGMIAPADPAALAHCFDSMYDRRLARRMGQSAYERLGALNIGWEHALSRLLA